METWKIRLEKTKCTRAGCPLPAAREYYALLALPECARRDVCAECFEEETRRKGERALVYWKARRQPGERKEPTLDVESLRALFWRLGEAEGERAAGLRYLVALLLLRRRALRIARDAASQALDADLVVVDAARAGSGAVALRAPELGDGVLEELRGELLGALGDAEADDARP
jgi:hypothetical protein